MLNKELLLAASASRPTQYSVTFEARYGTQLWAKFNMPNLVNPLLSRVYEYHAGYAGPVDATAYIDPMIIYWVYDTLRDNNTYVITYDSADFKVMGLLANTSIPDVGTKLGFGFTTEPSPISWNSLPVYAFDVTPFD
nr:MAG TPA: hypothetical protein [Caudoviricetes sp.]